MKLFRLIVPIFAVIILFFSCRKPTNANWDVDLVIPVVNSSLNIKNFLSDTIFKADNTGLLHLVVNREIASIKLDSLLNLPDTTINQSFPVFFSTTVAPGFSIPLLPTTDLTFNIGDGIRLKRADIKKCLLKVKFSNDIPEPLAFTYQIPSATKNGSIFTIKETIPTGNNSLVKTYDLSGYSLNLKGLTGSFYNTIIQNYTILINPDATQPITVTAGQALKIELSYSEIVPEYVEGYFGQQTIVLKSDTAKLGLSQNIKASNFLLSDVTMNMKLLNEFGVEFNGSLENITAFNSAERKSVTLQTTQLSNMNINRATKSGVTVQPSVRPLLFNKTNSNIVPFISVLPDKVAYQGTINVNPLGNISGYNDFAFYNTGIRILADIDIPVKFSADYFALTSTATVDFSKTEQLDNVKGGNFVIQTNNGYPFNARIQAYMLNEVGLVIDSLFINGANTIEKGQLNSETNLVVKPVKSSIYLPVTANKIDNLKKCKKIKILTKFLVPSGPPDIQILESYKFDINIVAEITYNVATNR